MADSYQQQARIRKATAIAVVLSEAGVDWLKARTMAPQKWRDAAVTAGTLPPSTATQALVLGMLLSREVTPV